MLGAILGAGLGGVGSLVGGLMARSDLREAQRQAGLKYQAGIDALQAGNDQQREDYQPWVQGGLQGLGSFANLLGQGNQAVSPTASKAFSFDQWKDPGAQYMMDQSNGAINASAIARGAVGGGLGKALQANSQNLANQAYSSAYQRYLAQNQQDFGQGQQLWNNETDNWKTKLGGYQGLAGLGMQAQNATGQLGLGYTQGVNGQYQGWGDTLGNIGTQQAGLTRDLWDDAFTGLGRAASGISDFGWPTRSGGLGGFSTIGTAGAYA